MAFSDELNKATEAEKTETTAKAEGSSKNQVFTQKGASLRAQMTEDQKAIEGSKSDKVAFICTLGDPNKKQSRKEGKENKPSFTVVGYKFKVLEDMEVPKAPLKADFKSFIDVEPPTMVPVKAGTVVVLNLVETGMFISRTEFAGRFTGEGQEVSITAKHSQNRTEPLPVLRQSSGAGSIKSNMELIADMVGATATSKGTPKIKEEFAEVFGVLYTRKSAGKKSTGGADRKEGEATKNVAAAFRALYAGK